MAFAANEPAPNLDSLLLRLKSFACVFVAVILLPCRGLPAATRPQSRAAASAPRTEAEPIRRLSYHLEFATVGRVHIRLETESPVTGTETLELPSRWSDARDLERGIENLKITGSAVALEPTGRPSRLLLRARPGTTVRLDYDLVQDWTGPFRSAVRHRVLLHPTLFQFNGGNALVAPRLDGNAPVQVSFDFAGLPPGMTLVTSFGTEAHQAMSGPWSEVADALFTGGEFVTRRVLVQGGPVLVAAAGHWSFSEQELLLKLHAILGAERQFWRTPPPAWYAVVLAPFEVGNSGGGGSAFTHAFSLNLAPAEGFGPETESLFAHEAFHAWNPAALGTVADAPRLAWFTEGVTTFYQDVFLERSHLLDRAGYVARLNTVLRESSLAPALPPGALADAGTSLDDQEARYREPYLRGARIALWLNGEILAESGGRSSLDDLMRALLAGHGEPLTTERIVAAAGRFVGPESARQLRSLAETGAAVPLPATLGPCLALHPAPAWSFALGMPAAQLVEGAVLHDVDPEGAAARAGLRDGQTLLAWSLWYGDSEHEVVVTVRPPGGGPPEHLHYLPRGRQVSVPQAEVIAGCSADGRDGSQTTAASP